MNFKHTKICSIIVCYNPDVSDLSRLCHMLLTNNCNVILIDNSEKCYLENLNELNECTLINAGGNTGIAHAQNIGITRAINNGAEVIVFFDQDSTINSDFLPLLVAPLKLGTPGVVSPVYYEHGTEFEYPSFSLGQFGLAKPVYVDSNVTPYSVDIVISSGTAVTVETFEMAGLMDEDLFIDFVDTEWCLRCRRKNIPIQVVPKATMEHAIGHGSIKLYFLTVIIHSPVRCYYQIRNCFLLFRKDSVPLLFAARETAAVFLNKLLLLFFVKNKLIYISNYFLATLHGIMGVGGKKAFK